ncbi:MAG: hypothetical protein HY473_00310 [Candidatus Sungbacteria bacterium]|uniref:Uncharacterized protein n=1 Tax=Candidatus Sungiibacteriota bacterium TaxID=2750080 RepID=A0A932YX71_9BACT|nr:hypothetical protein [Candidatus Sungbacteria bacterium]
MSKVWGHYKGKEVFLDVIVGKEAIREGGEWKTNVIARCGRSNYVPVADCELIFRSEGDEHSIPNPKTDGWGVFSYLLHLSPTPGKYYVSAEIKGTTIVAGDWVTVSEVAKKPKNLHEPQFRAEGDEGNYIISGSLTWEDGSPAQGVPVRLLISPSGKAAKKEDYLSDARGFVEHSLEFRESECDVTIQVGKVEKKLENLQEPSLRPKPKPYERPQDAELTQGTIWDVVRSAWKRGADDAKGA